MPTIPAPALCLLLVSCLWPSLAVAQTKMIYLAPDDHTDFIWSATEHDSYVAFQNQLNFFLGQITSTAGGPARARSISGMAGVPARRR